MSIRKRGNAYQVSIYLPYGNGKVRIRKQFRTMAEAEDFERSIRKEMQDKDESLIPFALNLIYGLAKSGKYPFLKYYKDHRSVSFKFPEAAELFSLINLQMQMQQTAKDYRRGQNESNHTDVQGKQFADEKNNDRTIQAGGYCSGTAGV